MKTLKLILTVLGITFLTSANRANAQTVQKTLTSKLDNITAWCLNRPIDGEFVYHFTYHIDKTGKVDRIHWNTAQSDVWDSETKEKYKVIDTGNDNGGVMWNWWNNVNSNVENQWDVENGWLPVPEDMPIEGSFINMNLKYIGKGGNVFRLGWIWQLHINANGEVTVEKYAEYADCD